MGNFAKNIDLPCELCLPGTKCLSGPNSAPNVFNVLRHGKNQGLFAKIGSKRASRGEYLSEAVDLQR